MLCNSHKKIWNLANHMKKNWRLRVWCFLFCFLFLICKISNFNIWTSEHFAPASCTELTLRIFLFKILSKLHLIWSPKGESSKLKIVWNTLDDFFDIQEFRSRSLNDRKKICKRLHFFHPIGQRNCKNDINVTDICF